MDSAVRTGTRLRSLLVRFVVTAGLVLAAWLISSLMAGSASASTSTGQADTEATTSSQQEGLLGGLLGGLTQTVGNVLGGTTTHESVSDTPPDADTGSDESSTDTTLPDLLTGITSSAGGTASTEPAAPAKPQVSEPPAVKRESHSVTTPKATPKTQVVREHRATPKRATTAAPTRPAAKPSKVDADKQVQLPVPSAPSTPQAPPAPSTTISAGHDTTTHGKSWFLATAGDATLAPPTATGTAIDHRATAVARDRDRPATAPD